MNNQSIDSKKLDDFYEEILPSIKNFLKDYLLPSVISPENKNEEYVSKFLGDLLQEKLEKIISEELASEELALENSITNDVLVGNNQNENLELALENSITNDVLVGNNQNENLDNEIPVPSIETIEGSRQKRVRYYNDDSDGYNEPSVTKLKRRNKKRNTNNSKPVKKTKVNKVVERESDDDDQDVQLINDAEVIVKDISAAFNIKNTELVEVEVAPTRITSTVTEYSSNNTLNIHDMVEQELNTEKEVLVLEGQKQKAEFNYYYKLYEWSQRKDQQVLWIYNNPEVAKSLGIKIDSNISVDKCQHRVR
jgi:hypothetical protein